MSDTSPRITARRGVVILERRPRSIRLRTLSEPVKLDAGDICDLIAILYDELDALDDRTPDE